MTCMHFLIPAIALLFAACGGQQAPTPEFAVENPDPVHNSRTSLDWAGTYSGTLPCADCEGIATRLTILENGTFTMNVQYLGRSDDGAVIEGTFVWEEDGNHIVLQGAGRPSVYQVGENRLWLRDPDGKPITGELAENYVLHRSEGQVMGARSAAAPAGHPLEGTYWKLVEVMGKPVTPVEGRIPAHMLLHAEDKRVAGNSGCNTFFATYELEATDGRISFSKAGSTMMACPDMSIEQAFHKALEQVDSYLIAEDGRLSLHRGKMAPLMRFEAVDM